MKKSIKTLMAASLVIPSVALIQSANQVEAQTYKEVTSHALNVRSGPGSNYKVVDWLEKGDQVTVLKDQKNWDYIEFNGRKGYVSDSYLKTVQSSSSHKVSAYWLTLRNGPSANNKAIDYLEKGTSVTVLSTHGSWVKISVNGKTGYVNSKYLTTSNASSTTASKSTTTSSVKETKEVTAYSLTMRSGAGANHKAIDYLMKGEKVNVLSYSGDWAKVTVNGKTGYVHNGYLKKTSGSSNTSTAKASTQTMYVSAPDGLNLRSGRGVSNKIVTNMKYGSSVKVSSVSNGWGKIDYNGKTGFANVSYLTSSKPSTQSSAPSSSSNGELKGKLIVLDPGHGGKFAGAHGYAIEEDVNLQIALKTRDALVQKGAKVIMTRTSDVNLRDAYRDDLNARPALATKMGADAFISIHANAAGSAATGSETFWYNSNRGDKELAANILDELGDEVGMRERYSKYANFAVLRGSTMPSVLVETGYVTNKSDAAKLNSPTSQQQFAKAITEGIERFFE